MQICTQNEEVQMCTEITAFLLCYSLRKKLWGITFLGNLCTYTCWKCFSLNGPPSDTFYKNNIC